VGTAATVCIRGATIRFLDVVRDTLEIIEREGRVGRRALKRHLAVDDETFEDLIAEISGVRDAVLDDGEVLVWKSPGNETAKSADPVPEADTKASFEGERRQLTIMFCDLVGSSAMSGRIDPEDLRDVMTSYQGAAARAVAPLGGHIAEYLGDGIVVYFGFPSAYEDAPVRAVHAALAILEAVSSINRKLEQDNDLTLQVRIGVHTGLVVLAEIGDEGHRKSTALGEVPNVTARLQQVAGPDEIVLSEVTERLVRGFFELESLGRQSLRGIVNDLHAFRVIAAKDVQTRFEATGSLSDFVGREREFESLQQAWGAVRNGAFRAVLVAGEAGIGKSRLVQEIGDRIAEEGGQHLKCRCSPHHQNTAYYPISDMISRRIGLRPSDSVDDQVAKLETGLASFQLDDRDDIRSIASILSIRLPDDRYPTLSHPPQRQKLQNLATLRRAVSRSAEIAPFVLVIEDIHWIDPTSAEFLRQLRIPGVLLILTSRLETDISWVSELQPNEIPLDRLSKSESRQLIDNVTRANSLPRGLIEELLAKTEGIPLFVEEQTRSVMESGLVMERDGGYELTRPLREMAIAETLQDSLRVRLDRLDRDSRLVAQLGSIVGRSFSHELLEAVAPMAPTLLQNALTRLLEAGILSQHGDAQHTTYFFRHALVQDVAYQSLLRTTRREYHNACAEALITWFPEAERRQPELIAHHCRAAGDVARAVKYYELAGEEAANHWALHEAIDHVGKALSILGDLPDDSKRRRRELGLLFLLGPALMSTLGYANKAVEETYFRIRELCESEGMQAKVFPALVGLWQHNMVGGSLDHAKTLGGELLAIAAGAENPTMQLIAMRSLGSTLFLLGEFDQALHYTGAGWQMYDVEKHGSLAVEHGNDQGVAHGVYRAWALWIVGQPTQALEQARATLDLAESLQHPMSIAFSHSYAATVANLRCDFADGEAWARRACEVADEHGLALWSAHARTQLGWARIGLGDIAAGMAKVEAGTAAWFQTGAGAGGSLMHAVAAEAHILAGDFVSADAALGEAEAVVSKTGERFHEAELLRLRSELAFAAGADPAAVQEPLQRGIELARSQGARSWELRLANSLAARWSADGGAEAARSLLSSCLGGFGEGLETRDAMIAKHLLNELA
jgi:predicted ATPase/class 3 adenylate cyclase